MNVLMLAGVASIVALVLLLLFVVVRWLVEKFARWRRPTEPGLMAEQLPQHLAVLRAPQSRGEELDRRFERMVGRNSLGLTAGQGIGYVLLGGVLVAGGLHVWQEQIGLSITGFLLGSAAMLILFALLHRRWNKLIQEQLPDAYHLLARSLRAGLTLEQSVGLLGDQGEQPLASEFRRCAEHLHLGLTMPAALRMTAERIQLSDFKLFVSMLVIHRQMGGNLALLVDRMAATVRSRNQFRGQVAAITALGRLSGLFLVFAAPLLMIGHWLLNPDYLQRLTEGPQGVTALVTAVVLEVVGVVWMLWLLRVD